MAEFVKAQIKADKVVVFLKPTCSYCVLAKDVLSKYKFKDGRVEFIDINGRSDMGSIQDYLQQITNARTVSILPCFVYIQCNTLLEIALKLWTITLRSGVKLNELKPVYAY